MEWLIEHAEDPTIDAPLPGQASSGGAGAEAEAASEAAAGTSTGDEEPRDELTEIFKKIRRKREFRADSRVCVPGPGSSQVELPFLEPLEATLYRGHSGPVPDHKLSGPRPGERKAE